MNVFCFLFIHEWWHGLKTSLFLQVCVLIVVLLCRSKLRQNGLGQRVMMVLIRIQTDDKEMAHFQVRLYKSHQTALKNTRHFYVEFCFDFSFRHGPSAIGLALRYVSSYFLSQYLHATELLFLEFLCFLRKCPVLAFRSYFQFVLHLFSEPLSHRFSVPNQSFGLHVVMYISIKDVRVLSQHTLLKNPLHQSQGSMALTCLVGFMNFKI